MSSRMDFRIEVTRTVLQIVNRLAAMDVFGTIAFHKRVDRVRLMFDEKGQQLIAMLDFDAWSIQDRAYQIAALPSTAMATS